MALEIIKWLLAIAAAIQRLARSRTELTGLARVRGAAMRTCDDRVRLAAQVADVDHLMPAYFLHRWRDAVAFQLLLAAFTHPVGGPCGRQLRLQPEARDAMTLQYGLDAIG